MMLLLHLIGRLKNTVKLLSWASTFFKLYNASSITFILNYKSLYRQWIYMAINYLITIVNLLMFFRIFLVRPSPSIRELLGVLNKWTAFAGLFFHSTQTLYWILLSWSGVIRTTNRFCKKCLKNTSDRWKMFWPVFKHINFLLQTLNLFTIKKSE